MNTILIVLKLPVFDKIPYVTSIDGIKTFDVIQTNPSTDDMECLVSTWARKFLCLLSCLLLFFC